jgi:hypothetical protein
MEPVVSEKAALLEIQQAAVTCSSASYVNMTDSIALQCSWKIAEFLYTNIP